MKVVADQVAVFGASGMLAHDLIAAFRQRGAAVILADLQATTISGLPVCAVDITDRNAVLSFIQTAQATAIVNCAAYTKVDDAESNSALTYAVNAAGAGHIAEAAARARAQLVHISTDYVFGGRTDIKQPIAEDAICAPLGVYGSSKYYGELLVQRLCENSAIVRTSWLHGTNGPNFIDTMVRLAAERTEVKVVDDQIGSPTWTGWLADVIVKLVEKKQKGIFHASSQGDVSWYDLAVEIFKRIDKPMRVERQTTAELNRPAPRPAYSTLAVAKLERSLQIQCPTWQEDIAAHLKARGLLV